MLSSIVLTIFAVLLCLLIIFALVGLYYADHFKMYRPQFKLQTSPDIYTNMSFVDATKLLLALRLNT